MASEIHLKLSEIIWNSEITLKTRTQQNKNRKHMNMYGMTSNTRCNHNMQMTYINKHTTHIQWYWTTTHNSQLQSHQLYMEHHQLAPLLWDIHWYIYIYMYVYMCIVGECPKQYWQSWYLYICICTSCTAQTCIYIGSCLRDVCPLGKLTGIGWHIGSI